ncbi:uncharacterized protein EI90DRAFT_3060303 [Cantharellus anzutake]|uniref:uncharacterized protein n=1 Tax=Cantharellus anzutake TaxID=1750568 RepID=UPI00190831ED|nr:uncharacterized protein EI90DRAFT_3060303 [Cantharellus anzutake]KAF8330323.1 hypothetical protein EI90DRAFT_3060303 [Cantharellus anzutake]
MTGAISVCEDRWSADCWIIRASPPEGLCRVAPGDLGHGDRCQWWPIDAGTDESAFNPSDATRWRLQSFGAECSALTLRISLRPSTMHRSHIITLTRHELAGFRSNRLHASNLLAGALSVGIRIMLSDSAGLELSFPTLCSAVDYGKLLDIMRKFVWKMRMASDLV